MPDERRISAPMDSVLSFHFAYFFKHRMDITGPDQVFPVLRNLAGKNRQILKSGEVHFQALPFLSGTGHLPDDGNRISDRYPGGQGCDSEFDVPLHGMALYRFLYKSEKDLFPSGSGSVKDPWGPRSVISDPTPNFFEKIFCSCPSFQ